MSIFPCDCPMCADGVCDEDGICVNCGYDYLADSDPVDSDEILDECEECGMDLYSNDLDNGECPDCGHEL